MNRSLYTIIYSACLGIACALLLTAAASITEPYKEANKRAEEIYNILTVLNVPFQPEASSGSLVEIYNANVQKYDVGGKTVYEYIPADSGDIAQAYAVQFSGQGLWGPIKGLLALESDKTTIRGLTFFEQEETPGLGGEITAGWFRSQFVGKSILDNSGNPGIIIKSAVGGDNTNQVDAITGATMTCDKVQSMLNISIEAFVKELD